MTEKREKAANLATRGLAARNLERKSGDADFARFHVLGFRQLQHDRTLIELIFSFRVKLVLEKWLATAMPS